MAVSLRNNNIVRQFVTNLWIRVIVHRDINELWRHNSTVVSLHQIITVIDISISTDSHVLAISFATNNTLQIFTYLAGYKMIDQLRANAFSEKTK